MPLLQSIRDRRQRIISICGMAMVWPSIHNQILYPISFAFGKEDSSSLLAHFLLYSVALLAGVIVINAMRETALKRVFAAPRAPVATGIACSVGIALIVGLDFSTVLSSALVAAGIVLAASFIPVHFVFWSVQIADASEKGAASDLIASYFLFCLITVLRTLIGADSWIIAIAAPLIAAALSIVALQAPQKAYPLHKTSFRSYPQQRIVPAVSFVYIASVSIWLLNPETALEGHPGMERAAMYMLVALFMVLLYAVFRPEGRWRAHSTAISSGLCIALLVVAILIAGIGAQGGMRLGNFPVIAAKIVLEMGIWLIMLTYSQSKHLGIVKPSAVYLVFVVGATNLLNVFLLFATVGFSFDRSDLPILAVSAVSAIVVLAVVNLLLATELARKENPAAAGGGEQEPTAQSAEPRCNNDELAARMQAVYKLSSRETDTLRLALANASAKEMASSLFVAESTVNSHLKSIYRKADVHSKKELIALAQQFNSYAPPTDGA